ncbi:MAG: 2-phospho-L-lactate guanylyltransferase [Cellvibrionaceae bacterium]|nr:2-phospho-L-lactate guanylyltransferase [Cellvibrionaceae bacterium]|tara:strand:+ start:56740 stop:57417 length:678 start_codon:yes stop_codon:yes gene_type:complete
MSRPHKQAEMAVNFVVPIKQLQHSKQRLKAALTSVERQQLTQSLYHKNLRWLKQNYPAHNILVVTPDLHAAKFAKDLGADLLLEPQSTGLNNAIEAATQWSIEHGFQCQLTFFPDIANPDRHDMDLLLEQRQVNPGMALAVSSDGGTNCLLTTPPNITPFMFGHQSARRYQAYAYAQGLTCLRLEQTSLANDIDCPQDLQHCLSLLTSDHQKVTASSPAERRLIA